MKRIWFVGGVMLLLAALGTGVADAHGTLDKKSVPGNTDINFVLDAPVEVLVGFNDKVVLNVPDGFRVISCGPVAGYSCKTSSATKPTRTLITWTSTSPTQNPVEPVEKFPFKMHTISTTGKYKFDIDQSYSNGETAHWNGAEGTASPAAFLEVTGEGTPAVTNTTIAPTTNDTTATTFPSYDFGSTDTTIPFNDTTVTTAPALDTTATTIADTTDTTSDFAISPTSSSGGGGGKGIHGVERAVLLALAVLFVGLASVTTLKQRA